VSCRQTYGLHLVVLGIGVGHFSTVIVGDPVSGVFDVLHQSVKVITRGGNTNDAYRGAIPKLSAIQLRHGNVEARPKMILQTPDDLPAILNRLRCFDVKFEREKRDGHCKSGQWPAFSDQRQPRWQTGH
jgi:hypothetical protein